MSRFIFEEIACPSAEHRAKVRIVTDEAVREYLSKLGRRGADATNNQLTPAQRKKKAKKAAQARWAKQKKDPK
jgi:protein-disulfide isomerase